MAQLPFLVVHGAAVWKTLLVVGVAATFALGYALRQLRAKRAARTDANALRSRLSTPKVGAIVVRGKIREGTATTVRQVNVTDDLPSSSLVLDCNGERVELKGAIRVEQGTKVRVFVRKPKDLAPDLTLRGPTLVQSVAVGDDVIVAGILALKPSPAETASYREGAGQWTLTSDAPIRVLAVTPQIRAMPWNLAQLTIALILIAPMWYGILHVVGSQALSHRSTKPAAFDVLPSFGSLEIAAAMPGSRDQAIENLSWHVRGMHSTPRGLELSVALTELRGDCPVEAYEDVVQLEPALAAARRCGTHQEVLAMLAFLGRFDDAEKELAANDTSALATTIHVATGHWKEAAEGVEASATKLESETPSTYRTTTMLHQAAITQRCLEALFRTYGGDKDAFAHLTSRSEDRTCAILEAASRPVAEQAAAFATLPEASGTGWTRSSANYDLDADELQFAAGGEPRRYLPDGVTPLTSMSRHDRVWLAPFQLAAHPDDVRAHTAMVVYDVMIGDLAAARAELPRAEPGWTQDQLALALALREGAPADLPADLPADRRREHYGLAEALLLRHGKVTEQIQEYLADEDGAQFRANLQRALDGDGDGLADVLREPRLQWQAFALPLLGVLPRITIHRDHALAALRMFRNELTTYSTDNLPFRTLTDLLVYRDLARLAGDTEDAAQWKAIVDRYAKVLADRQKLTALLFWAN